MDMDMAWRMTCSFSPQSILTGVDNQPPFIKTNQKQKASSNNVEYLKSNWSIFMNLDLQYDRQASRIR
jgi:hypothetical protein